MFGEGWESHLEFIQSPPSDDGLDRMASAVHPGATVSGWERAVGGLGAAAALIRLMLPDGRERQVFLKRFRSGSTGAVREHRRLQLVHQHLGSLAPEPLALDGEGRWFGTPALVMSWIDGRTTLDFQHEDWAEKMGAAIAALHLSAGGGSAAAGVPTRTVDDFRKSFEAASARGPWSEVVDVVRTKVPVLLRGELTLVHGDYHPGNLLWRDGRVVGIVDWEDLARSRALEDVGLGRVDALLTHGRRWTDRLRHGYEVAIGGPVDDAELAVWDLVAAIRARRFGHLWLTSFHEAGRPTMTREMIYRRLRRFSGDRLAVAADLTAFRH